MLVKIAFGNVRKSFRDFGVYFLTVVLGVAVFYAFNSLTDQRTMELLGDGSSLMDLLVQVIQGASIFVAIVLAFLVVYANRFLVKRRKREFGIYLVLGMSARDVRIIVVLETALVGAASLICGLAFGWLLSQGLMHVTASLFKGEVPGIAEAVSGSIVARTAAVFAAVFLVTALMNARSIARTPLVGLICAARKNEEPKLRSLPWSIAAFLAACAFIALSYRLLLDNGLLNPSPQFAASTALVCAGTVLFFYALSGFLLRAAQSARGLYFRGLNMFTLRQLNSKVNSTFMSMSIVCMTLFLAITSACGGIGITNALSNGLERTCAYDLSVRTVWANWWGGADAGSAYDPVEWDGFGAFAASCDYDMARGLTESARTIGSGDFAKLAQKTAQIDYRFDLESPLTIGDVEAASELKLADFTDAARLNPNYTESPVFLVSLSQVNEALELAGKPSLELRGGECLLIADSALTADFLRKTADTRCSLDVGGKKLAVAGFSNECLETIPTPLNVGALVVPDKAMPTGAVRMVSVLDVVCAFDGDQAALGKVVGDVYKTENSDTWPITMSFTRADVIEQSMGTSAIVAFLAVYLGFVLTVTCAAVLAIQQLTEASDNARRYRTLRTLGALERSISASLFIQVGIYFLFPLLLALCHTACALNVVTDVVAVVGHMDIDQVVIAAVGTFLAVYGLYFVVTFVGARALARDQARR